MITTLAVYKGLCELNKTDTIETDEDPGLRLTDRKLCNSKNTWCIYKIANYIENNTLMCGNMKFISSVDLDLMSERSERVRYLCQHEK